MVDLHQRFIQRILDPLDLWRIGEAATSKYFREFQQSQFLPLQEIQALQLQRYQALLTHAHEHCPYYRERLAAAGMGPSDLRSLEDVQRIPILEKKQIQQHRDAMVSKQTPTANLLPNQTGGSTGTPISFFLDIERKCSREAAARRHDVWAGWNYGDKIAFVWGAAPDFRPDGLKTRLRNLLIDRSISLNTGAVTTSEMRDFHTKFEQFRPKIILAYAKSLTLVTKYFISSGLKLKHRPQGIVTSAEVLSDSDRELLEDYYQCKVFNRYGCREVSVIASECDQHDGLHVMAEGLYVEIVKGNSLAEPGEAGSVVVTDLLNYAMPLIRYRIGDVASMNFAPCTCGRELPRLNEVEGRVTDFLVADDGRLVSGVFLATYVLAQRPSLGQVQILQKRQKQVRFRFTGVGQSETELAADIEFLRASTAQHLGAGTELEYEVVESIPNEKSGKFTFCRSEVSPELMLAH